MEIAIIVCIGAFFVYKMVRFAKKMKEEKERHKAQKHLAEQEAQAQAKRQMQEKILRERLEHTKKMMQEKKKL